MDREYFAFLRNDAGALRYFDAQQRSVPIGWREELGDLDSYDCASSISLFYPEVGNRWSEWAYNPYAEELLGFSGASASSRADALNAIRNQVDWHSLCGDVAGVRSLISQIQEVMEGQISGSAPDGAKLFETKAEALKASDLILNAPADHVQINWAQGTARSIACDAARKAGRREALGMAREEVLSVASGAEMPFALDVDILSMCMVCDGLGVAHEYMEHMRQRWACWMAGYAVLWDLDGVIYAYRRPA